MQLTTHPFKVYNPMIFRMLTELYSHRYNQFQGNFHPHPQISTHEQPLPSLPTLPSRSPGQPLVYFVSAQIRLLRTLHVTGIIWSAVLGDDPFPEHPTREVRSCSDAYQLLSPSCCPITLRLTLHRVAIAYFIYSFLSWWPRSCFSCLVITNNAAVNI